MKCMDNIKLSKLKFYNLSKFIKADNNIDDCIFKQYNKIREEFYEFCVEFNNVNSYNFLLELLDLIQSSINLYHIIQGDDMSINKRLLNKLSNRIKQGEFKV